MSYALTIHGDTPSKKNSKRRVQRGAHLFMIPSKKHEDWHGVTIPALHLWKAKAFKREPLETVKQVAIEIYAPNKRKCDLTNKAESVMDALVDAGILLDDNWFVVGRVHLHFGGVDKENPRAEVVITV